ncbi:MAG: hypothetical protein RIQ71_432 [Verrucomicrobiota bacterium]
MKTNISANPDHHIWNNNGTYWCHYTVHEKDYTKKRVRVSLGTKDVEIARALRDFIMEATPKIAANIPRVRGHAMPDIAPEDSESHAVAGRNHSRLTTAAVY